MSQAKRIFNQTRRYYMKRNQALKGVENGAFVWLDESTVRDTSLAERVALRNQQAAERDPLPHVELPHIKVIGISNPSGRGLIRLADVLAHTKTEEARELVSHVAEGFS